MSLRQSASSAREPRDAFERPLHDLRISVTDRCNFRCPYCMPREVFGPEYSFLDRSEILSFEEIRRLAEVFASLGARKIRITGGEPLLRRNLPELIAMLSEIQHVELALTTNGSLLEEQAESLAHAGLDRVTVSLDALDGAVHRAMSDTPVPVQTVLSGIDAAARAGLTPIKINAVVRRGTNEGEVARLARHFRGSGHILRFIEYMDVGMSNGWSLEEVVSEREILEQLRSVERLDPIPPNYPGEVAHRYKYRDGVGEVGVVASVTKPFCGSCTRARLSTDGQLLTCLFASSGLDLRGPMRAGATDAELRGLIRSCWRSRTDRYSEERSAATAGQPRVEMSYIGG